MLFRSNIVFSTRDCECPTALSMVPEPDIKSLRTVKEKKPKPKISRIRGLLIPSGKRIANRVRDSMSLALPYTDSEYQKKKKNSYLQ